MKPLEPSDRHHHQAAIGWLLLNRKNYREASEELWQMNPRCRRHLSFLHIWWHICSKAGNLDACLEIAKQRIRVNPDDEDSWADLSYTLHEMNRTVEALDSLLAVADKFPNSDLIPHNLACYLCKLGRMDEARYRLWQTLAIAAREGRGQERYLKVLNDLELQPLWPEIRDFSATNFLALSHIGNVN